MGEVIVKVVHVGLGGNSGSAAAVRRLNDKLKENGVCSDTVEMTFDNKSNLSDTMSSGFLILKNRLFYGRVRTKKGYPFFSCEISHEIKELEKIKAADIIHLHWVEGFYSLSNLKYVLDLGKPIVWTCHDSWIFTGGCCVKDGCHKFETECKECKYIIGSKKKDISYWHFNKKKNLLKDKNITFIAPSQWMKNNLEKSFLKGKNIRTLFNVPGFHVFGPRNREEISNKFSTKILRDEKITILVGADSFEQEYKGMQDVLDTLALMYEKNQTLAEKIRILIVGKAWQDNDIINKYEHYNLGHIDSEYDMSCVYSMADILMFPSHDDNLPYMVIESLACGTPVLAYAIGGIPEIIEHKQSGYLVEEVSVNKFCDGVRWLMEHPLDREIVAQSVRMRFDEEKIVKEYIELYSGLL